MMAASYVCGVETWLLFVFVSLSLSLSLSLLCCWMPIFDLNHLYSKLITLLPRLLVFVSVFSLVFVPIFTFICASVFVFVFSLDAHFWPQSPPTTKQSGRFQASLSLSLSLYLSLSLCPYLYYSLSSLGCWTPILTPITSNNEAIRALPRKIIAQCSLLKVFHQLFSWQNFAWWYFLQFFSTGTV